MPRVKPTVKLLQYTGEPERTVALAAKLCYSDATIEDLDEKMSDAAVAAFLGRLANMGHQSPVEHASFTFGIEGVSRAFLAQSFGRLQSRLAKRLLALGLVPVRACRMGASPRGRGMAQGARHRSRQARTSNLQT